MLTDKLKNCLSLAAHLQERTSVRRLSSTRERKREGGREGGREGELGSRERWWHTLREEEEDTSSESRAVNKLSVKRTEGAMKE